MKGGNKLSQWQSKLGIAKHELIFSIVLLIGLALGIIIKLFPENEKNRLNYDAAVYAALDSLAEAKRTSYIGSDIEANPDSTLIAGDTIIKQHSLFPNQSKKILPTGKININTASKAQLMRLPGVGDKTADLIIEFRANYPFHSPRDIMKIKGIGIKKYEKMAEYITVE